MECKNFKVKINALDAVRHAVSRRDFLANERVRDAALTSIIASIRRAASNLNKNEDVKFGERHYLAQLLAKLKETVDVIKAILPPDSSRLQDLSATFSDLDIQCT